jgi:hypothetical protein
MLAWAIVSVTLLSAAPVRADVIMGPRPADPCPDGMRGAACMGHGTDYCVFHHCTSDESCDNGATCEEVSLCMGTYDCGYGEPASAALGRCEEGACSEGTCEEVRVCTGGCDCNASGSGAAPQAPAALLLGVLVLARSIRRGRRRGDR